MTIDAWEIIAGAKALLLDFDGPITALMPPPLNAQAAEGARAALKGLPLPNEIRTTTDHIAVLRFAGEHYPERFASVERACSEAEVECARTSSPSPEAERLIDSARRRSVPIAIVSNNSANAVRGFLTRFSWAGLPDALACRPPEAVSKLKPDPLLVIKALQMLGADAGGSVFVGDSVSDVQAGRAAGVKVVGLAKSPDRGILLLEAGAVSLIERRNFR